MTDAYSQFLCFFCRTSLYSLVNKTNLVHNLFSRIIFFNIYMFRATMGPSSGDTTVFMTVRYAGWHPRRVPPCIPDSHPHRITRTKRRINTVVSPDDGHIFDLNMQRLKNMKVLNKLCTRLVLFTRL